MPALETVPSPLEINNFFTLSSKLLLYTYCVNYPSLHYKLWPLSIMSLTKDLCILLMPPLSQETSLHKVYKLVCDLRARYMYSYTSTSFQIIYMSVHLILQNEEQIHI